MKSVQNKQIVGRFAPSPTGEMHLGNVLAALLSWLSAKRQGGLWRLRIEDLDPQRSRREYAEQLMRDLEWLGLTWDGEVVWQSNRTAIYEQYLELLRDKVYPCTCTRNEILAAQAPHESDGRIVYPGTCRNKNIQPSKAAIRLIVPDEHIEYEDRVYGLQSVNLATHCGDFIVRRSDGVFAYQLAVVVDDAEMGVTEIVRGRDLLLSAAQQLYLYRLFGLPEPQFCHHPLLVNEAGQRLCKRDHSLALSQLRKHYTAPEIIGSIAYTMNLTPTREALTPEQLIPLFNWSKITPQDRCP
ncbi:MAG: tRNA glutamyl-Q(34) synthetase GluQRS [Paludibacteraceae bacterium]|nr:tRNA glutamyl-Q(34) synthetase GluQRS [Paludibacteraceae bacterium]